MGNGREFVGAELISGKRKMENMRLIDTHAHLFDEAFVEDLDEVVIRARERKIEKIFLPNIDENTLQPMLNLCDRWPDFFYPMLGLHPTEVRGDYDEVLDRMERWLTPIHPFIGIGEVGLDYYWDRTYYREQQSAFCRQIEWALAYDLPLMIHSRSSQKELVDLLQPYRTKGLRGVFHSFGGTWEEAQELLAFDGFMIGINGTLTFKKSVLSEVLRRIPLNRVVLETDAPYLTPMPYRGRRNESSYVWYTMERMAEVYGLPCEEVARRTYENALKVYLRAGK